MEPLHFLKRQVTVTMKPFQFLERVCNENDVTVTICYLVSNGNDVTITVFSNDAHLWVKLIVFSNTVGRYDIKTFIILRRFQN
jgi:hypothetical protein